MDRRPLYFSSLDGLRAISVVLVIIVHLKQRTSFLSHIQGWLGVDVFFVLSGFLITTLLIREEANSGSISLSAFYMRRFFRIVPVYLLVVAVYIIVCHHDPAKWIQLRDALPYYLSFMNEFVPEGVPLGATWTIGVEEKFYLFWPVLFVLMIRNKRAREYKIAALYLVLAFFPFRMARSYSGLLNGCVLGMFLSYAWRPAINEAVAKIPGWALVLLVLFGFYLVDCDPRYVFLFSLIIVLLVANLMLRDSVLKSMLGSGPMIWIGKRSYSMYLIHGLALDAVYQVLLPTGAIAQLAIVAVTTAVAALGADQLYRWVEQPSRRYGKRLIRQWTTPRPVSGVPDRIPD